jgi:hypothetical protein
MDVGCWTNSCQQSPAISHKFEALFGHRHFGDATAFLSNVIKMSDLNVDILFV